MLKPIVDWREVRTGPQHKLQLYPDTKKKINIFSPHLVYGIVYSDEMLETTHRIQTSRNKILINCNRNKSQ